MSIIPKPSNQCINSFFDKAIPFKTLQVKMQSDIFAKRSKSSIRKYPERYDGIQINSSHYINALVFDCDHEDVLEFSDYDLPVPTVTIVNKHNGRHHHIYYLENPVPLFCATTKTKEYLKILDEMLNNDVTQMGDIILSPKKRNIKLKFIRRGYVGEQSKLNGTWFYKDLALDFFRFLDTRFAIMCDQLLKKIITQSNLLHIERDQTKVLFHPLTDTVKDIWIPNQESEQSKRWAYQIIMDLANLKAIEMTSKQYKEIHNISNEQIKEDKKISIRDYMSKDELEKIKKAEEHINGFIKYGEIFSYQILKEKLFKL